MNRPLCSPSFSLCSAVFFAASSIIELVRMANRWKVRLRAEGPGTRDGKWGNGRQQVSPLPRVIIRQPCRFHDRKTADVGPSQ